MHTPTPWHVGIRQADKIVYDAKGRAIANATVYHWQEDREPLENAKFIVQACNAHDALVARAAELGGACNTALADLTLHKARHLAKRGYEDTVAVLRAALAKR